MPFWMTHSTTRMITPVPFLSYLLEYNRKEIGRQKDHVLHVQFLEYVFKLNVFVWNF